MARAHGKALRLTVTLTCRDGEPGHPSRIADTFIKIGKMIREGSTAGEIEQEYTYSQGGESNRDIATVRFEVRTIPDQGLDPE
jgi:hypothetical protein